MSRTKTMDLTEGSVMKRLLLFTIPIVLGNLLQQLYTAADRMVVGQFARDGATALAAIGATGSATNLTIGLFVGIATGNNVICANLLGAKNTSGLRKNMHTSLVMGAICGLGLLLFGVIAAPTILGWMGTPKGVAGQSSLYMRLFFLGVPGSLLFNIGAGILRAHGDTKRPMYILIVSGLVNVVLNLVLVVYFHLDVAGVAIATVASQYLSAVAVLWILFSRKDCYGLRFGELKIHKAQASAVIRIGVPTGLGSIIFSASNVIIQSSVNSFDDPAIMAGSTVALDLNNLIYQIEGAIAAACISFSGQCYGARKLRRIDKLATSATLMCYIAISAVIIPSILFSDAVVRLFNQDPQVLYYGKRLHFIVNFGLLLYVPSEIFMGCSRGMKRAVAPTVLNVVAICGTRIFWILFVFPRYHTIEALYVCYPVSWTISSILQICFYYHTRRKVKNYQTIS